MQAVHDAVVNWFAEGGASCVTVHAMLRCTALVGQVRCDRTGLPVVEHSHILVASQIEALFSTRVSEFKVPETGTNATLFRVHPDDNMSMPVHLDGKLLFVSQVRSRCMLSLRLLIVTLDCVQLNDFPTFRRKGSRLSNSNSLRGRRLANDLDVCVYRDRVHRQAHYKDLCCGGIFVTAVWPRASWTSMTFHSGRDRLLAVRSGS